MYTRLGENVTDPAEADAVARHYHDAIDRIHAQHADCEPSVKLTQLGLDLDRARAADHVRALAEHARTCGTYLWVDMEQSPMSTPRSTSCARRAVSLRLVSACRRTSIARLTISPRMVSRGIGVRLVKGAYKELPDVALQKKSDVDEHYFTLARTMLMRRLADSARFSARMTPRSSRASERTPATIVSCPAHEFHLLYGIQRDAQRKLASKGAHVRVLIAYGDYWFPWYMRRLAERPANVWFVVKNLIG